MDDEQAKFLLGATPPSGADESRPDIAEALKQAGKNPELAEWFACEQRSDRAMAKKLGELEPPADLRARLLAGGRVSRRTRTFRRRSFFVGLAAILTLSLATPWILKGIKASSNPPLLNWQQACVAIFDDPEYELDVIDFDYEPLEAHLLKNGARVVGELPFGDEINFPVGCKLLDWNETMVSLACFDSKAGQLVHIFVVPRGGMDESLIRSGVHRQQVGKYATVTWLRDDIVVMVASKLSPGELEKVFADGVLAANDRTEDAVLLATAIRL